MICLVDRSNLEEMWPHLYPGLSRAEYRDHIGFVYSLEDVYGHIANQEMVAYYQVESGYAGVASSVQFPQKRILTTFLGGKDPAKDHPINLQELDDFLMALGQSLGAQAVLVEGRKGWEKWTKPLGYSSETINLWKEVPT